MRGASRGVLGVGQARRPRAGLVSRHSGGPGTRSGGTRTAPQGACWTGTGNAPRPRKRGPGDLKSPQWSAERRLSAIASGGDTPRKRVGRFRQPPRGAIASAPRFPALRFPSGRRRGNTGVPRAAKNRGDDACPRLSRWQCAGWHAEARRAKAGAAKNRGDGARLPNPMPWARAKIGTTAEQYRCRCFFPRCTGRSFLAISARFPVGVKRPQSGHPRRSWYRRERSFRQPN